MTSSLRADTLPRIVSSDHDPGHAEQGPGADCLQRALVPRYRFRQRLSAGVMRMEVPEIPSRAGSTVVLQSSSSRTTAIEQF